MSYCDQVDYWLLINESIKETGIGKTPEIKLEIVVMNEQELWYKSGIIPGVPDYDEAILTINYNTEVENCIVHQIRNSISMLQ